MFALYLYYFLKRGVKFKKTVNKMYRAYTLDQFNSVCSDDTSNANCV